MMTAAPRLASYQSWWRHLRCPGTFVRCAFHKSDCASSHAPSLSMKAANSISSMMRACCRRYNFCLQAASRASAPHSLASRAIACCQAPMSPLRAAHQRTTEPSPAASHAPGCQHTGRISLLGHAFCGQPLLAADDVRTVSPRLPVAPSLAGQLPPLARGPGRPAVAQLLPWWRALAADEALPGWQGRVCGRRRGHSRGAPAVCERRAPDGGAPADAAHEAQARWLWRQGRQSCT